MSTDFLLCNRGRDAIAVFLQRRRHFSVLPWAPGKLLLREQNPVQTRLVGNESHEATAGAGMPKESGALCGKQGCRLLDIGSRAKMLCAA
jgi:hypothetical protein